MNSASPLIREQLKTHIYERPILAAPFLYWLSGSKEAVRQAVEASTFVVVLPGHLLFEADQEIEYIRFMAFGSVAIENTFEENEDGRVEKEDVRTLHSRRSVDSTATTARPSLLSLAQSV